MYYVAIFLQSLILIDIPKMKRFIFLFKNLEVQNILQNDFYF